jgi:hypothetical protein
LVNDQASLVVSLKAHVLQSQSSGVWATADGNQDGIGIQGLFLASLGGFNVEGDGRATDIAASDFGVGQEFDALITCVSDASFTTYPIPQY